MGLLGQGVQPNAQKPAVNDGTGTPTTGAGVVPATAAKEKGEPTAEFKAKKAEAAKRFKERRTKETNERYQAALKLRDYLSAQGLLDKLPAEQKDFIVKLCLDPAQRKPVTPNGFGGPSVFAVIYGDKPAVGQSVTLEEVFHKTLKGKSTLDVWIKRWADKGIEVECALNEQDMLKTTYTIKALPAA